MNEENKESKKEETSAPDKGERGEIGQATPGLVIQQRWHQKHFLLENAHNKAHPYRRVWVPQLGAVSLKAFARKLAKEGDAVAKRWLDNKLGKFDTKRSEKNATEAKLAGSATKVAKKKKKNEGGGGSK